MAKVWNAKIINGKVAFSEFVQANFNEWKKVNEGKEIQIKPCKKPVSEDLREFYFAAVIPVVRSTCQEWLKLNGDELHQVLKKMFNFFETYNPVTKRTERFGKPTMSNNEWTNTSSAMEYLMKIQEYLTDCGLEMPNPEDYKEIRDSGRLINE